MSAHRTPAEGMLLAPNYAISRFPHFTSDALLHLISLAFHLLASHINITAPFSNIKESVGSISAHHQAMEQKLLYSHSILL